MKFAYMHAVVFMGLVLTLLSSASFCLVEIDSDGDGVGDACEAPPVGGFRIHVDVLGLLALYIGLASAIVVATTTTAIYVKRRKKK